MKAKTKAAKRPAKMRLFRQRTEGAGKGKWVWRVVASNRNILSMSSEAYENRADCIQSARATWPALRDWLEIEDLATQLRRLPKEDAHHVGHD